MHGLKKVILNKNFLKRVRAENDNALHKKCHCPAVPPRTRIPLATKFVYGLALSVVPWIYPAWVLTHLQEYQAAKK